MPKRKSTAFSTGALFSYVLAFSFGVSPGIGFAQTGWSQQELDDSLLDKFPRTSDRWTRVGRVLSNPTKKTLLRNDGFTLASQLDVVAKVTRCHVVPRIHFKKAWGPEDEKQFIAFARNQWQTWWENSGKKIAANWESKAAIHQPGWEFAFHQLNGAAPSKAQPPGKIWIPSNYRIVLNFRNGDWQAATRERWVIRCTDEKVGLVKIAHRCIGQGMAPAEISIESFPGITKEEIDTFLAATTYLCEYQIYPIDKNDPGAPQGRHYYHPNGTVSLESGAEGLVWRERGFDFFDKVSFIRQDKDADNWSYPNVGVTRALLLATLEKSKGDWQTVYQPDNDMLELLRTSDLMDDFCDGLLSVFGSQKDLDNFKTRAEKQANWQRDQRATVVDRVGEFSVSGKENFISRNDSKLGWTRFRIDQLSQRITNEFPRDDLKVETEREVDWVRAGKNISINYPTKLGERNGGTFEGYVYTWRCVSGIWDENNCSSGVALIRESAVKANWGKTISSIFVLLIAVPILLVFGAARARFRSRNASTEAPPPPLDSA